MDNKNILHSNYLDILFEDRNKEYGAYELRSKYAKRLTIALLIMFLTIIISIGTVYATMVIKEAIAKRKKLEVKEVVLENINFEEEAPPPPPPKLPPPPPKPKVEMKKFTPPKIVKDDEVKEDEKPPEVEELKEARISTINQEGIKDIDVVAPPDEVGVSEGPSEAEENKIFTRVEIQAGFPGGEKAWKRYITREIERYMDDLVDDGFVGQVVIEFIVDKSGIVSNVRALNNAGTRLAEVAINAIKNGPPWSPAVQNGRSVKAYRRQPVSFVVE